MDIYKELESQDNALVVKKKDNGEQRGDKWFKKHIGIFTGSGFSDLMTCDRSAAKKGWDDRSKWVAFGKTAVKYIYQKAMERKYNRLFAHATNWQMEYGTRKEPEIIEAMRRKEPKLMATFEEVQFISFLDGIAGASPDGKVKGMPVEMKARVSIGQFYDSTELPYDEKHQDFWQHQGEMLAMNADSLLYCVAVPPVDPFDKEEIIQREEVWHKIVPAFPEAQEALKYRIEIAHEACNLRLKGAGMIDECLTKSIENHV